MDFRNKLDLFFAQRFSYLLYTNSKQELVLSTAQIATFRFANHDFIVKQYDSFSL